MVNIVTCVQTWPGQLGFFLVEFVCSSSVSGALVCFHSPKTCKFNVGQMETLDCPLVSM